MSGKNSGWAVTVAALSSADSSRFQSRLMIASWPRRPAAYRVLVRTRTESHGQVHVRLDSRNPAIRIWPGSRGLLLGADPASSRPSLPRSGPAPPLTCPSSFLEQPKFQATMPANSAAALRHSCCRHFSRVALVARVVRRSKRSVACFLAAITSLAWRQRPATLTVRHSSGLHPTPPRISPPACLLRQVISHRIGLSKHHVLANARASHTNHPALGLCSGIFGIAGRGGIHQTRDGGVEGAVDGCRRHSNINIDSSKRLAQAQPLRASRRQLIARPSPSFPGRGSSWTAERLYFGHSLIAVYIMGDITSRLQLACLGEGRRGSHGASLG